MADKQLAGTVALVTGATSGIGRATALVLARDGAAVCAVGRRTDRLTQLVEEINVDGGTAMAFAADLSVAEQNAEAVRHAVEQFGRLDIVVNNAGVMLLGPVAGETAQSIDTMIDINVRATMYMAVAALPYLREAAASSAREVADMVIIGSVSGRVARGGSAVYGACKSALSSFSEAFRQETAGTHVRVGLIEPGLVDTELAGHNSPTIVAVMDERFVGVERLDPVDVGRAVDYMIGQPRHAAINELVIRPTQQV